MSQTKITVKIFEKMLRSFDREIDKLFIKRDAFLNHILRVETEYLTEELKGKRQSSKARSYIAGELKRLGTHTVNIVVDKGTADQLNKVVDETNMVRDAFMNRLILFLRTSGPLLKYLDLPTFISLSEYETVVDAMPTSPLKAIETVHADPLYYLRTAAEERYGCGLYLLPLPPKMVGLSCYLGDDEVPGTKSYAEAQKEADAALSEFLTFEAKTFSKPLSKGRRQP